VNGRLALGLVLVLAGTLWLLAAADVVEIDFRVGIGILLVAIGVALAVSRTHRGVLVAAGVLLLLVGVPALFVDEDVIHGGVGNEEETPSSGADLEPFRHGIGRLTVDLTSDGLEIDGATIEASVGIGELLVLVPTSIDFTLDAHVGAGNIQALDEETNGVDADIELISGTAGSQEITLDLEVGIGNLRVEER
jgi:hypothetical protein